MMLRDKSDINLEDSLKKLAILGDAAKYDVSCASSGVQRAGSGIQGTLGNSVAAGICHSFTEDGRCVSLLKVLMTNECIYDCKYCINRRSNDVERTRLEPEELARITMEFYKRNYIEGLFLSSAVARTPDDTMLDMCRTMYLLRHKYGYYGYIHCKVIPSCDAALTELAGRLADRISANIELPSETSLRALAPQKKKESIVGAFKYIHGRIEEDKSGIKSRGALINRGDASLGLSGDENIPDTITVEQERSPSLINVDRLLAELRPRNMPASYGTGSYRPRTFAPGGQSTQMIIGATDDRDWDILKLTQSLYGKLNFKRVYYSAYIAINSDAVLPSVGMPPPLLREHRLYQADWLLRFYRFDVKELLDDSNPNLNLDFDPKCTWALRHLDFFPIDVNRADYDTLLRVPGIGVKSAQRIIQGRRLGNLTFDDLKKIGVVLKRAQFFITCAGRTLLSGMRADYTQEFIGSHLSVDARATVIDPQYHKLSLFDNSAHSVPSVHGVHGVYGMPKASGVTYAHVESSERKLII